ncbi:MAG: hypothetical protein K2Y27_15615, partial [Xanthobacteraceae bacterium]|nr:hypothetical protein [Xanthobacteraceae bacterium]
TMNSTMPAASPPSSMLAISIIARQPVERRRATPWFVPVSFHIPPPAGWPSLAMAILDHFVGG